MSLASRAALVVVAIVISRHSITCCAEPPPTGSAELERQLPPQEAMPSQAAGGLRQFTLLEGSPAETNYWVRASGIPGPVVMLIGGMHGNEPAGAEAARQIRDWPVARGALVVLPRANVKALAAGKRYTPGADEPVRNLNRNFHAGQVVVETTGPLADAIWEMVQRYDPQWLVDLHEGYAIHRVQPKSVGSSIIAANHADAREAATVMLSRVNEDLPDERDFMLLQSPVAGSLARAFHEHYDRPSLILETTFANQRLPIRVRQHRQMMQTLLVRLGMLTQANAAAIHRVQSDATVPLVALYDDGGVGSSVNAVERALEAVSNIELFRVDGVDIRGGVLAHADVVVCPGGSGSAQSKSLRDEGRERIRRFVAGGGAYLGVCAGGYLACDGFSWGLKILDAKTVSDRWKRGVGEVEVQWTDQGRRIWETGPEMLSVRYANGPIWTRNGNPALDDFEVLGYFRTELAKNDTPVGVMVNSPAAVRAGFGKGRVLCLSPHLEMTPGREAYLSSTLRWLMPHSIAAANDARKNEAASNESH